jgi:alpha-glucoside transport system substrate-binding protein
MRYRSWLALLAALVLALTFAACGGDDEEEPAGGDETAETAPQEVEADETIEGRVQIAAIWTGAEQRSFEAVIDGFNEKFPNVNVRYNASGDQLPTVLSTAVEGGNPPDLAVVAQPGLVEDFQGRGALQPLSFAEEDLRQNFSDDWLNLGAFENELYVVPFKGANKSTIWYNVQAFEDAGVEPPATWDELMQAADTLQASGTPAYSIAGADGWTLTDLFENIYLRTAGPEMYDQLADHEIEWTDPSVVQALEEMARVFENDDNIAGGRRGALQADFPTSVSQVFSDPPDAAMVIEGDFVRGVIDDSTEAQPETDYNVFEFPQVGDSQPSVMGGGDLVIMFEDSPAAQALVRYLASAEAAQIWAERGGFASPNQNLDPAVYPDELTRTTSAALAEAETFRFDLSDLAPAEFGGTPGQGMWQILQDFLDDPSDAEGTAQQLERAASRAYD